MFGTGEMLIIALVAIIVVDPKKLPDLMKSLGKALGEFKQMSGEFKRTIERETEAADFEKRRAEAEQKLFGDKKEGEAAGASGEPTAQKPGEEFGSIAEDAQEQGGAAPEKHDASKEAAPEGEQAPKEHPADVAGGPGESAGAHEPRPGEAPAGPAASETVASGAASEPAASGHAAAETAASGAEQNASAAAGSGAATAIPVEAPQAAAAAGEPQAPAAGSAGTPGPSEKNAEPAAPVTAETPSGQAHGAEDQSSAAEASAPPANAGEPVPSGTEETASVPASAGEPQAPASVSEPAAPAVSEPAAAPADGGVTPPPPPPPPTGDDAVGEGQAGRMSLFGHLQDLRKRLTRSAIAMVVGFLVCYAYAGQMLKVLMQPMLNALKQSHFIYTVPTEAFFTEMKVAFVAGIFVASPYIFYQIYQFVAPGLYSHERRWIAPIAFFSAVCFIGGALFGYFVVFPFGFEFFASYSNDILTFTPKLDDYFDFVVKLLMAFGIVFELPLFLFFLARLGIVTYVGLRKKRKYAVLAAFVLAAALTPPDAVSQTMMAVPLVLLYEVGIWLAYFFGKKKPKPQEEAPAA